MKFQCKKVENCFAEARTYEYRLPVTGQELAGRLSGFTVTENHRFRRPVFSAKRDGLEVKGILAANVVKINYTAGNWEKEKQEMEEWLEKQELRVLGETESVCPVCLRVLPAKKVLREDGVYITKECPSHGSFEALIWEGSQESYEAWGSHMLPADRVPAVRPAEKGCPLDCGLCEKHERRGCCVLLEVTERCNLRCPVCFASAGENPALDVPLEELELQMKYLMDHGGPFNIQLSGGEPTVREDLEEIISRGKKLGFSFFQLNTNGIRLAEEPGYARRLRTAGLSCVFLQFDGLRDDVYVKLRGKPLLDIKKKAIEICGRAGLGVVLVPVIAPGVNEDQVGEILAFAESHMPVVRGVHFQPVSYFGRCLEAQGGYRMTIPRLLALMEEQTGGRICAGDFTGGNATNPYCTFQANYLRQKDGSLKPLVHGTARASASSEQAREFVARQWSGGECCCGEEKEQEEECCCCGEEKEQEEECCCCGEEKEQGEERCCCGEEKEQGEECCCCGEEKEQGEECCCCGEEKVQTEESQGCCCGEDTRQMILETSSLDEFLADMHRNTLAISGMLFQDAWNLDLERLRRCYILETDRRYGMVPFCAYNLTDREGRSLYR